MPDVRAGMLVGVGLVLAVTASAGVLYLVGAFGSDAGPTLTVALSTFGAEVLDPSLDGQNGQIYYGHLYDRLLGTSPDGSVDIGKGALEGWTASADSMSYTLRLRRGMHWHDGLEVTAEDLKFSLEHYARRAAACTSCGSILWVAREIRVSDRHRVEVILREPDINFIARLGPEWEDVPLLPFKYWEKVGAAGFAEHPVGSGPWKFSNQELGEFIEFEANLDYWDPERVPGFRRLRLVRVPEKERRLALLRTGEVDMAPVAPEDIEPLKTEGFTIQGPKYVIETTLRFFMSYDPRFLAAKPEFRKALNLGIDRESIVESVYPAEAATPIGGSPMFSPLIEGYDPGLPPYPYDPALARQLLREAGYEGERVHLLSQPTYGLAEVPLVNSMVAEAWRQIGVDVEIVEYPDYGPVKVMYTARPQRFDGLTSSPVFSGGHVDRPGGIINSLDRYLSGSALSLLSYHDLDDGDRIYDELLAMPVGPPREQRLKELNRQLYDEYWAVPIVWRHDVWAVRSGLSDWSPTNGTLSDLHLETVRSTEE
jgi:peptide/nickel transport system substrate-binding protein